MHKATISEAEDGVVSIYWINLAVKDYRRHKSAVTKISESKSTSTPSSKQKEEIAPALELVGNPISFKNIYIKLNNISTFSFI